jgi:GNAT superfamily N-acetyltransferase
MRLKIREASQREASIVSEVLTEAAVWLSERREPLWDLEQIGSDRVSPDCQAGLYFLAWSGPAAVGTMRLTDADPHFWPDAPVGEAVYLHRLAVRRVVAGGQVSSALLRRATQIAAERGAQYLRLDAEASRSRLRQVYERFGFHYHSGHTIGGVHVARYQLPCAHAV